MPRIIWSNLAILDLDRIEHFLDQIDPGRAVEIVDLILDASRMLESYPRRGSPIGRGRRSYHVGRYRIVYRVTEDVEILRVHHARENWR